MALYAFDGTWNSATLHDDAEQEAYQQRCKNWAAGDTPIDIVGFSRGAALALDFANKPTQPITLPSGSQRCARLL